MNWKNPKTDIPPEFDVIKIKVFLEVKGEKIEAIRQAVFMQGSYYNTDLDYCITHKVEAWMEMGHEKQ